ncbi:hypothetical protein CAP31_03575 [Sulfuriferula sp. AH1]|uniref:LytR C-terminal domain-containing protein n=1 Tax=Sulfuriferula sp. AH1 TaxID=1985873 RepID=UPI000B3B968E|nr:LytR C-terminal domain-containing protein [Sulfuriferula sp. AH1]ARU30845.1 hypothetical protein CAP31_03575 [Sulfuriferula sp. AH1]
MRIKQIILPAMCCLPLLSGCTSYQSSSMAAWQIKPVTSIRNSTEEPGAYYQLGRYYQGQNRYEQAALAYRKALAANNNFVEARNGLGVIYSLQGKYAEAIEVLKVAVQQSPKSAHIYNNLGYAYYLQGQNKEAVTALQEAAKLDPGNQRALNNLGLAYAKAGDNADSIVALTKAIKATETVLTAPETASRNASQTPADHSGLSVAASAPQSLALPGGVINRTLAPTIPQVESQVKAVQVAPNVYELHEQHVMSIQSADTRSTSPIKLEIANGNGVTGMAKRVKQFLHGQGYVTERLTNQKPFRVQITQIQYRNGHQLEAQRLQSSLPKQASLVQNDGMHANINVRLVLGRNIAENIAFFDGKQDKIRLAFNER